MKNALWGIVFLALPVFASDEACPPKWGYLATRSVPPDQWAQMDPVYAACDSGLAQSPVNIVSTVFDEFPKLYIKSHAVPLVVQNTSLELKVPAVSGSVEFGAYNGVLTQFHFHSKGEHQFDGVAAAAELHFVYESPGGAVLVLGILIDKGTANTALQKILDLRPGTNCASRKSDPLFDPANLLPGALDQFYEYSGSLTTPNCKEGVTWILFRQRITASQEQLDKLVVNGFPNARPVQPLGDRKVARNF